MTEADYDLLGLAQRRVCQWLPANHAEFDCETKIAQLLGYHDYAELRVHYGAQEIELCKKLVGPYGYPVYRMLLVKRGLSSSQLVG